MLSDSFDFESDKLSHVLISPSLEQNNLDKNTLFIAF